METLEFTIYPDGRVVEQVTGISGASCAEVTAAIEEKLGIVLNQEKTSEFLPANPRKLGNNHRSGSILPSVVVYLPFSVFPLLFLPLTNCP